MIWFAVAVPALLLILWYKSPDYRYDHFDDQSIPGPRPWPFIGTMWSIFTKGVWETDRQWVKTYGRIIGTYEGRMPVLLVSCPRMVKHVLVKEFHNFQDRRSIPLNEFPLRKSLTRLRGERWKHVRSTLTPTFSAVKLKQMTHTIGECARLLVDNLRNHAANRSPVNLKEYCGAFTMDTIAATAFGLKIDSQRNSQDPFVKNAKQFFGNTITSAKLLLIFFFPSLMTFMRERNLGMFPPRAVRFFTDIVTRTLEERRCSNGYKVDFLQLMVEAERRNELHCTTVLPGDAAEKDQKEVTSVSKGLSHEEILAQSLIFFLAGYETTATTLSLLGYCLATNQACQQRALQEVDALFRKHNDVTYAAVSEMEYVDMCIFETLRLFPPVARTNRICSADTIIEGIPIKRGVCVSIPISAMHRDPDLWPDPDTFIPERFNKESRMSRDQYTWLPFGGGPRSCIGMRLAILEIKIALMHILRHLFFCVAPETQIPLQMKKGSLLQPTKEITLLIKHR